MKSRVSVRMKSRVSTGVGWITWTESAVHENVSLGCACRALDTVIHLKFTSAKIKGYETFTCTPTHTHSHARTHTLVRAHASTHTSFALLFSKPGKGVSACTISNCFARHGEACVLSLFYPRCKIDIELIKHGSLCENPYVARILLIMLSVSARSFLRIAYNITTIFAFESFRH